MSEHTIPDKLLAWVDTEDWEDSRAYLHHHPELLSNDAEHELELVLNELRESGGVSVVQVVEQHLHLLRRCREVGVEQAYREMAQPSEQEPLALVGELVSQPTWDARQHFVEQNPRLLEEVTLTALHAFIEGDEHESPNMLRMLGECHRLLTWCKEDGIPEAFARVERLQPEHLYNTLREFTMTTTWRACQHFVVEHPELLSDEADSVLESIVEVLLQEGATLLLEHGILLRQCRSLGVDTVFDETMGLETTVPRHYRNTVEQIRDAERRYALTGARDALDDGLAAWSNVLNDPGFDDASRSFRFAALQDAVDKYEYRYRAFRGDVEDLAHSVELQRRFLDQFTSEIPDHAEFLTKLGTNLHELFTHTDNQAHLDEAIACFRQGLDVVPTADPEHVALLNALGQSLRERYSARTHSLTDLNEAIACHQQALQQVSLASNVRVETLNKLSICLSDRYAEIGDLNDLQQALRYQEQASRIAEEETHGFIIEHRQNRLICSRSIKR